MAKQRKKLKILPLDISNIVNKLHYDTQDNLFAEEHYGYYLLCTIPTSSQVKNPRKYFYFKFKKEYYIKKNSIDTNGYITTPINGKSCILDGRMHHKELIFDCIKLIFQEKYSLKLTESLLIAIGIVIDILEIKGVLLHTANDFKTEHQLLVYDYILSQKEYKNQDKRDVTRLFSEISTLVDRFELIKPERYGFIVKQGELKEISSSLMYQLEHYALKELKHIKDKVTESLFYAKKKDEILSSKNLLFTLFREKEQNLNTRRAYPKLLLHKLLIDYGIDARIILNNRPKKVDLPNIDRLKAMSRGGVDIAKDLKSAIAWTKELFPYYPENIELNDKYQEITTTFYARKYIISEFGISVEEIEKYLYPGRSTVYPLYLLLLIRTGLNSEVLLDWKVKKIDSLYSLDGDNLGIMTLIESDKKRSNSSITCVIKNDSDEMNYINFFTTWSQELYLFSEQNNLFQYFNRGSNKTIKIEILSTKIIDYMKESPKSFFKKYEIFDEKNQRVDYLDHRLIRKSHNFQEYLKGKQEFERQLKKKHISSNTTKKHYENNSIEWSGLKKHKIAKSQNLLVSLFKGDITRNESTLSKLFNGSMADCKNNKNPTYLNAPNLKSNEHCIDWTKCLTSCEQSRVVPKIHGPVIYAWVDYMNKQKDDFINEEHWGKEYSIDYAAAIDTIKYFTEDEKRFCEKEMIKHKEFVKLILKRKVKVKGVKSA